MPSPYGRHRPRSTSAPSPIARTGTPRPAGTSRRRRSPRSVKSWHASSLDRGVERLPQLRELPLAAHHRRVQVDAERADVDLADAERGSTPGPRSALPFSSSGSTGSASTASRTQAVRRLAEQHLARRGVLLEARGDVHGVAGHERLARRRDRRRRPRRCSRRCGPGSSRPGRARAPCSAPRARRACPRRRARPGARRPRAASGCRTPP